VKCYCGDCDWYTFTITIKLCYKHFLFIRLLFFGNANSSLTIECLYALGNFSFSHFIIKLFAVNCDKGDCIIDEHDEVRTAFTSGFLEFIHVCR
jgi:hypothetical protein